MNHSPKQSADWSEEIIQALRLTGRVMLRLLSYLVNILLTALLIGFIAGMIVGTAFLFYVLNYVDGSVDNIILLAQNTNQTSSIYYMDWENIETGLGTPIEVEGQKLYGKENRVWVPYSQIPKNLVNAFVSIEDRRFWDHQGVDWLRTLRATMTFILPGNGRIFGASTITQQTIKNVTQDNDQTIQRKVREILRALNLEKELSKEQILEIYLNMCYLSRGCYGVQAAAYKYFGKDVSELTLLECAAIAGITQSPSKWDPISHPDNNTQKRNAVLDKMYEYGCITKAEYDANYNAPLTLNVTANDQQTASVVFSWYTDTAIKEAINLLMEQLDMTYESAERYLYTGGLKIVTVQNPEIQQTMEEYFSNEDNFPRIDDSAIQPKFSMVVMDPKTGYVLGLVGDRGVKTKNRILNYATDTYRSPGSSIKPLSVYGPALERGLITYGSVYDDTPVNFGNPIRDEKTNQIIGYTKSIGYPSNYSKTYRGLTTINYAVKHSLNTVAYKVLQDLTIDVSYDFLKNKLHFTNLVDEKVLANGKVLSDRDYAPLALGAMSYGCSVLQMTAAYQIFANDGVYTDPTIVYEILDSNDEIVIKKEPTSEILLSSQTASIMTKLLENVVTSGTAAAGITVDNIVECAGKTGTTSNDNDRWFIGYTPYYLGGVWFGYEQPASLSGFSAAISPAVKVWDTIMTKLHKQLQETEGRLSKFQVADGVFQAAYCIDSGKLLTDACRADPRGSRAELGYFTTETKPTELCDCHVMVSYDVSTGGGVALDTCPSSLLRQYGMLRVTGRTFPVQIYVADAEYVYVELPAGVLPSADLTLPYYSNYLEKNMFWAITAKAGGKQFNHGCTRHGETEEEPPETTDKDKDKDKTAA